MIAAAANDHPNSSLNLLVVRCYVTAVELPDPLVAGLFARTLLRLGETRHPAQCDCRNGFPHSCPLPTIWLGARFGLEPLGG